MASSASDANCVPMEDSRRDLQCWAMLAVSMLMPAPRSSQSIATGCTRSWSATAVRMRPARRSRRSAERHVAVDRSSTDGGSRPHPCNPVQAPPRHWLPAWRGRTRGPCGSPPPWTALRPGGLAYGHQLPKPVIACRPASLRPPLGQRRRAAQCARLAFQHVEIVFQVENLMRAAITALMLRNPYTVLSELNHAGVDASFDYRARLQRHGVEVGAHLRAACLIDTRKAHLGQIEVFSRKRQKMLLLGEQQRADALGAACQDAALIESAVRQQLGVQLGKVAGRRYGNPVVAAKVAHFAFHATLLMALTGSAKAGLVLPVRAKGDETGRQFPLLATQDLLHRARQVIVAEPPEYSPKIMKRQLMGFQKRLLRGSQIRPMIGRAAGHRTHRKHLQLDPLAIQIGIRFVPIHLGLDAPLIALRNEGLAAPEAQLLLTQLHVVAHRALGGRASRHLAANALPDALGCMALLARSLAIGFQNRVDKRCSRFDLHMRPLGLLPPRRDSTAHRISNRPTMHPQLPRNTDNRTRPKLILPANLLV